MPIIQSNETTDQHAYNETTVENDLSESGYEAMHSEHASFSSTTTPLFVLEEPVFDSFLIDEGSISSLSSWSSVEVSTWTGHVQTQNSWYLTWIPTMTTNPACFITNTVHPCRRISRSRIRIILVLTIFDRTNGTKYALPDQTGTRSWTHWNLTHSTWTSGCFRRSHNVNYTLWIGCWNQTFVFTKISFVWLGDSTSPDAMSCWSMPFEDTSARWDVMPSTVCDVCSLVRGKTESSFEFSWLGNAFWDWWFGSDFCFLPSVLPDLG